MTLRPFARWLFGGVLFVSPSVWAQAQPGSGSSSTAPSEPSAEPDTSPEPSEPSPSAESQPSERSPSAESQPSDEPPGASPSPSTPPDSSEPQAPSASAEPQPPPSQPASAEEASVEIQTVSEQAAADTEQEVQVLGSKASHAAGSVHVIREEQLERFEFDDVTMPLVQVPGVYVRQEDGIGLRPNVGIRGANPDRSKKVTLMEDGVLFGPAPYSAPAAYFFPLLTRMTQIHVVKGPSAINHGPQTVGGAVDLISRPIPTQTSGQLDLGLGAYGYNKQHAYFGTSNEQFGFLVEGVRLQNTGFKELPDGADTGSTRNEWLLKASYLVDPRAEISNEFLFKFTYTNEVSNETYLGLTDADFRENAYRRYPASALDQMKNHRTGLSLTHLLDAGKFRLKTTAYRNDYQRTWSKLNRLGGASVSEVLRNPEDPQNQGFYGVLTGEVDSGSPSEYLWIGPNNRTFVSQGVQSLFTTRLQSGPVEHKIEASLRLHNDSIKRRHTEDAYMMVDGELIYADEATITTAYNRMSSVAMAGHANYSASFHRLTVNTGARTELIWSDTEDYIGGDPSKRFVPAIMPGAGVYYDMIPGWGILSGIYRGFSPPAPGSQDDVKPEYSTNVEAGTRYNRDGLRLEAVGFLNAYKNMTDVCTLASGCLDENLDRQFDAGKALIYGVELFGSYELELPYGLSAPASVAYTFSQGEFRSSFESQDPIYGNVTKGDEMPYLPPHQVNATLALEHRYAGANASVNYVARMREIAGSGELVDADTTDKQFWLDVGLFARPLRWLTIYGNVRNVTAEKNLVSRRPYGARVNAPRWVQFGVKAEF